MPVEPFKNVARWAFNICINLSNRTHFWMRGIKILRKRHLEQSECKMRLLKVPVWNVFHFNKGRWCGCKVLLPLWSWRLKSAHSPLLFCLLFAGSSFPLFHRDNINISGQRGCSHFCPSTLCDWAQTQELSLSRTSLRFMTTMSLIGLWASPAAFLTHLFPRQFGLFHLLLPPARRLQSSQSRPRGRTAFPAPDWLHTFPALPRWTLLDLRHWPWVLPSCFLLFTSCTWFLIGSCSASLPVYLAPNLTLSRTLTPLKTFAKSSSPSSACRHSPELCSTVCVAPPLCWITVKAIMVVCSIPYKLHCVIYI